MDGIKVLVRVSADEKRSYLSEAERLDMTLSEWVRAALNSSVGCLSPGRESAAPVAKTQLKPIEDRLSRAREALSSVDPRYADMSNEPVLQYEE